MEENLYSFNQVAEISLRLVGRTYANKVNLSNVRSHAIKTGLAVRLNDSIKKGKPKYSVPQSNVPYVIRDLTLEEVELLDVVLIAQRLGYTR